ncbi:MAG: hypothetical protein ACRCXC_08720 [Legionella sp.]
MLQRILCTLLIFCSFGVAADDTILKLFRPFGGGTDQIAPKVKTTLAGECFSQSQLIVREDAWRCMAGGKTYDPCFVKAGPNRTDALCPKSPWSAESVKIMVKTPLNNEQNQTLDMSRTYPWAIELSNGEHCQAIISGQIYDAMPVRYKCSKTNYLVGHLQRCKTPWSILQKTSDWVRNVDVTKAWF